MMSASEFYQEHLDRVSRSFAFCIRQLPEPLKDWVGLSYLLCRIVDTIEDSNWPSVDAQMEAFAVFDRALTKPENVTEAAKLASLAPAGIDEGEMKLLQDAEAIFQDLHALGAGTTEVIQELVLSMSQGMQHFCRSRADGELRLTNLREVNQYCFFVAGIVGELLAKLLAKVEPQFAPSVNGILQAHHFGLFLQKVNLLKDQVGDQRVGRHLIPSREEVEASAQENAEQAFAFLLALPKAQLEFRRFCAWSLFLGLESLRSARQSLALGKVLKVARPRAEELISEVDDSIADDAALQRLFALALKGLDWTPSARVHVLSGSVPEWMTQIYRGPLSSQKLRELSL